LGLWGLGGGAVPGGIGRHRPACSGCVGHHLLSSLRKPQRSGEGSWRLGRNGGWCDIWGGAISAAPAAGGRSFGDAAGVGHADLARRCQCADGLAGLVLQQPARAGGAFKLRGNGGLVEDAAGDQVVEVAGGLPQHLVALPTQPLAGAAGAGDSDSS
jgi:hypothetical protein